MTNFLWDFSNTLEKWKNFKSEQRKVLVSEWFSFSTMVRPTVPNSSKSWEVEFSISARDSYDERYIHVLIRILYLHYTKNVLTYFKSNDVLSITFCDTIYSLNKNLWFVKYYGRKKRISYFWFNIAKWFNTHFLYSLFSRFFERLRQNKLLQMQHFLLLSFCTRCICNVLVHIH